MNLKFFGDSYDIVKHSLLRWLGSCGSWRAHPMFTPPVDRERAEQFMRLLDVKPVSAEALSECSDRNLFLKQAKSCPSHLFLDPDTGLRMREGRATREHLMRGELIEIAQARRDKLTLVFDQSLSRGSPRREQLKNKLSWLAARGAYGLAYESHACFILVSANKRVLAQAKRTILEASGLPPSRLVET